MRARIGAASRAGVACKSARDKAGRDVTMCEKGIKKQQRPENSENCAKKGRFSRRGGRFAEW